MYVMGGRGFCKDWVYLPEGKYPELLKDTEPLYNEDRIRECMNRCVYAAEQNNMGSKGSSSTEISDQAFYIRKSDQHCGCSSGSCRSRAANNGYTSYYIYETDSSKISSSSTILCFI